MTTRQPEHCDGQGATLDLSVVLPVHNEVESLETLHRQLSEVLVEYRRSYEILFIDDGSSDSSFEVLRGIQARDPHVRVVRLRRNFGQTAAMSAGFRYASGRAVLPMDADLQNDPADIPRLIAKLDEGYDVVSGWRIDRQDGMLSRRLPSMIANWLIGRVTGVRLHDYGCSLKAYRAEIVKNVHLYGEMHRFIPALASWLGARTVEIPVQHHARRFGKTKYGISRTFRVILDLITVKFLLSFSTQPLHIFGAWGGLSFFAGSAICVYLAILRLFFEQGLANRPLLLLGVLLVFTGIQFISMGLLAEMLARTYHESQDKPIYVIRDTLGFGSDSAKVLTLDRTGRSA
ncbi:MAG: glycosyltransferase family 2 protein [Candidatus Eiseniibacteriota bacterium]|jgi:glycosyltransferase involved in cell wall biosynthesis